MGQKLEVVRERLDVVDETVLLALREGSQSLNSFFNSLECHKKLNNYLAYAAE
jgi:hypothetical protein